VSTAVQPPPSAYRLPPSLRTWWTILRISLEERLVYRGDFMLGTLMRFLPIVTQIYLWTAVFNAVASTTGASSSTGPTTIAGYTRDNIIAYYLLTMIARAFSSMPGLASGIARSIRDGSIKKFITQPVDMIGFLLISRVAHKLVYYAVAIGPFALVFYLCRNYFTNGWPAPPVFAAFIASLVMAFLLGYFMETAIGMIGFWFLEVSSLLFVYMLFNFFLSGHMFPIDMLDRFPLFGNFTWGTLVRLTPLQYLAYFPSAVFLGIIQGPDLIRGLVIEVGWLVFFIFLSRWMYNRGLRRYSAYGG
jgi:ABC-2 type transport system permease protein